MKKARGATLGGDAQHAKLAEQIATELERQVIAQGLPVGHDLGNETALAEAFGVSRWVAREALAITEREGLTRMRRGRNGGIVVAATADDVLATAVCNYLLFARVNADELIKVRKVVDRVAYVLAATQAKDSDVRIARDLLNRSPGSDRTGKLQQAVEIYSLIMRLTNNPFVGLFGTALSRLTMCLSVLNGNKYPASDRSPLNDRLVEIRRRQLECIIGADANGVIEAAADAANAWAVMFENAMDAKIALARAPQIAEDLSTILHSDATVKRAAIVAIQIELDIRAANLSSGDTLASEPQLMERYGVGRPVLREAIRSLERYGLVRSGTGRGGGVRVGTPNSGGVVQRALDYFEAARISRRDVDVLAGEIIVLIAELLVERLQGEHASPPEALLSAIKVASQATKANARTALDAVFFEAASATRSPLLILLMTMCAEFRKSALPKRFWVSGVSDEAGMAEALDGFENALRKRDAQFARRAMSRLASLAFQAPQATAAHNSLLGFLPRGD
ncbi:MAG: GntR family transcriptional regulator [Caulobacterales bacterium]